MRTVAAIFHNIYEAEHVNRHLQHLGVPSDGIHVIAGNDANRHDEYAAKIKDAETTTAAAAASDASLGGGLGIVLTLVALTIPGVGPILALGALGTIAAGMGIGALGGGLIGALHHIGVSQEDAPFYEEAVRRGAVMVVAQVDDSLADQAVAIMQDHGARNLHDEADTWRESGWTGPHVNAHPYPSDDSIASDIPS